MSTWDGKERRQCVDDHDALTRMLVILNSHVENFNKHVEDDEKNFRTLNRALWVGIGFIAALEFVFKMWK